MLVEKQVRTNRPKRQSESSEQLCKTPYGFENFGSKLFGYRFFFIFKSLWNNWNNIVLTGLRMKPTKDINYILVE